MAKKLEISKCAHNVLIKDLAKQTISFMINLHPVVIDTKEKISKSLKLNTIKIRQFCTSTIAERNLLDFSIQW